MSAAVSPQSPGSEPLQPASPGMGALVDTERPTASSAVDAPPVAAPPVDPLLARNMRWAAYASLVANIGICLTGAGVRLTNSGLGCPTWPNCVPGSITPDEYTLHKAVEFTNRLLTFALLATALVCVWFALRHRPRRPGLLPLSLLLLGGIVLQALIGGMVVLLHLAPLSVSLHFLASAALVAVAAILVQRSREGDAPAQRTVPRVVQLMSYGLVGVLGAVLLVGTLVTSSGPNGGDPVAARLNLNMQYVAWLHADLVFVAIGLAIGMLVAAKVSGAPVTLWRRTLLLLGLMVLQGVIGYTQYFTNLPVLLVAVHVLGSVTVWAAGVFVALATRFRAGSPGPSVPALAVAA